jgi:hypothetical protein
LDPAPTLTLRQLTKRYNFHRSFIGLANKLIFTPARAQANYGGTYYEFGGRLQVNLDRLYRQVVSGQYRFAPYTHKAIKTGGRVRDLYLANWPDRIVERWMSSGINHHLSPWFSNHSYAYRPGKFGLDRCQREVGKAMRAGGLYILRRDISSYFYTIPHDRLLEKIAEFIPTTDPLFRMVKDRIEFEHTNGKAAIGVPFGSPIACVLANLYLTNLDRQLENLDVHYFRYADDFLVVGNDEQQIRTAGQVLDNGIAGLGLTTKPSHHQNLSFLTAPDFDKVDRFKFLGIEFTDHLTRLGREKQRKIVNLFKREFKYLRSKLKRMKREERFALVVETANAVVNDRIRSAAIIDYYLKHVTDEVQLRNLDLLIAKEAISAILGKKFRYADFSEVSYKSLRKAGMVSLVHRKRLHAQGHLKVNFLSVYNYLMVKRQQEAAMKRRSRLDQAALRRKEIKSS